MNYCQVEPGKGKKLFAQLKKNYGYNTAVDAFLIGVSDKFLTKNNKVLDFDDEGVPTYDSLIKTKDMIKIIGTEKLLTTLNRQYGRTVEDSISNYYQLLESARTFNTQNSYSGEFIALVVTDTEGLKLVIERSTKRKQEEFNRQYSTAQLNSRLVGILGKKGLTIGMLEDYETKAGRLGVTDFSLAKEAAQGFVSMIRVANNAEGAHAITEEFSHLIIGMFKNSPLTTRAINFLSQHPELLEKILGEQDYKDTVEFHNGDMMLVAEEALGHMLVRHLQSQADSGVPLAERNTQYIIEQFGDINDADILQAIVEADTTMGELAQQIMQGQLDFSTQDVAAAERNVQFNALATSAERKLDLLKEAHIIQIKRGKMTSNIKVKQYAAQTAKDLELRINSGKESDLITGILNYSSAVLRELRHNKKYLDESWDSMDIKHRFKALRRLRQTILSYQPFMQGLSDEAAQDPDIMQLQVLNDSGETVTMYDACTDINHLLRELQSEFNTKAFPAFAEFLKSILGADSISIPVNGKMETVTIEDILKTANSDISMLEYWLDSMADSADVVLQLANKAVMKKKDEARLKAVEFIKKAQAWQLRCKQLGITDFTFMLETHNGNFTGNYVHHQYNWGAFNEAYKKELARLKAKYNGRRTDDFRKELSKWLAANTDPSSGGLRQNGDFVPRASIYPSTQYDNLTDTQKKVLKEYLDMKAELDKIYPQSRVNQFKAIQMRRSSGQRLLNTLANPTQVFNNAKETVLNALSKRVDDVEYGSRSTLLDFDGQEFMQLPVMYAKRLENPTELSTDAVSAMIAYAYSAYHYEAMKDIVDAVEIGSVILDPSQGFRKTTDTIAGKPIQERLGLNMNGDMELMTAKKNSTRIFQRYQQFKRSQVYSRYYEPAGAVEVFGHTVATNKIVSGLLKMSSFVRLGFNFLCNTANVITGICMTNIEAAAGEYFKRGTLFNADKAYASDIVGYVSEMLNPIKTTKLGLFCRLFNTKQTMDTEVKNMVHRDSIVEKVLGKDIAFLGQECGDHWLYNRVAIAMAMEKQVMCKGKKVSLWDALQVRDFAGDSTGQIKELNENEITELDGRPLDVGQFSREIAEVNHDLFGIYNNDDMCVANNVAGTRLFLQFRKWMKVQFNRRFEKERISGVTGKWREGYWRTVWGVARGLIVGQYRIGALGQDLTEAQKANLRRALAETAQFILFLVLANCIDFGSDQKDKRPWAQKFAEYICNREVHELGNLIPSFVMLQEIGKTITNPIPSVPVLQDILNLTISCVYPGDWMDTLQNGPFKGHSTFYKHFIKAPLPGFRQIFHVEEQVEDIGNLTRFYTKKN